MGTEMTMYVRCSKGTYIRTLCNDLGEVLGCGACMSSLRRTAAGCFSVEQAHTMDEVVTAAERGETESLLLPVDVLFSAYERLMLSEKQEKCLRNGGMFSTALTEGRYRAYGESGEFIALAEAENGIMHVVKSFYEV